jgi:hypothetical protein
MTINEPNHGKPTVGEKIAEYRKAIAGFIVPGLVVIIAALLPGSDGGTAVTVGEWLTALVAVLTTSVAVARVPNDPPTT